MTYIQTVTLASMNDLPQAFEVAIDKVRETLKDSGSGDIWDGTITLLEIRFERNFRRSDTVAVFRVDVKD